MSDFGYGQQEPSDTTSDYGVLVFIIEQVLASKYFTRVVQVVAVNEDAKTVDVQIATNQLDGQGNSSPHGITKSIPYVGGQFGTSAFKMTPGVGDLGMMAVNDRDLSSVKVNKSIANPGSLRKFAAADGIYLWSILNKQAPTQFIEWTSTGLNIQDANGNGLTTSSSGWAFTGNVSFAGNIELSGVIQGASGAEYAGTITTSGDVVAGTISLQNHEHTYLKPAVGSTTPTPTTAPIP